MDVVKGLFATIISRGIELPHLGMTLIGLGAAMGFLGSIFWRRAARSKADDALDDNGELRSFIDSREAGTRPPQAREVRPRINQIRDQHQS